MDNIQYNFNFYFLNKLLYFLFVYNIYFYSPLLLFSSIYLSIIKLNIK